jgi:uncharacterized OB-fold protein
MSTAASKPIPAVTPELRPFFDAARAGTLVVQRCRTCGERRFPPRDICSRCLGRAADWVPSSGRGKILTWNVMHQVYHPGFANEVPYAVVLVELDDGGRMISNLVGYPNDRLEVGLPVEVTFEKLSEEVSLPKFRPAVSQARSG